MVAFSSIIDNGNRTSAGWRIGRFLDSDGDAAFEEYRYTVYDGANPAYEMFDPDGLGGGTNPSCSYRYLYGPAADQILAVEGDSFVVHWGLADHEGTIRDVLGTWGSLESHRKYDSFGKLTDGAIGGVFSFGFDGMKFDSAVDLYFASDVPYDPATGRRLREDPIGFASGTTNLYVWSGNNPVNVIDASGRCSQSLNNYNYSNTFYGIPTVTDINYWNSYGASISNESKKSHNATTSGIGWANGGGGFSAGGEPIMVNIGGGYTRISDPSPIVKPAKLYQPAVVSTFESSSYHKPAGQWWNNGWTDSINPFAESAKLGDYWGWISSSGPIWEKDYDNYKKKTNQLLGDASLPQNFLHGSDPRAFYQQYAIDANNQTNQLRTAIQKSLETGIHVTNSAALATGAGKLTEVGANALMRRIGGETIRDVAASATVDGAGSAPMTGYTWNQVLKARYGAANVEWVSPKLPSEPLTVGVLRTPAGNFDLASGWNGYGGMMPKGSPGFDIVTRTHVEGQAAALMQRQGIGEGVLYINNSIICPNCTRNLPYMLGPGRTLEVVLPNSSPVPFTGGVR